MRGKFKRNVSRLKGFVAHKNIKPPSAKSHFGVFPGRESTLNVDVQYRGTSLVKKTTPLGPYRRPTPRALGGSQVVGVFS